MHVPISPLLSLQRWMVTFPNMDGTDHWTQLKHKVNQPIHHQVDKTRQRYAGVDQDCCYTLTLSTWDDVG